MMKRKLFAVMVLVLILLGLGAPAAPAWAKTIEQADIIARGAYIAREADCAACHVSEAGVPYGGGKAIESPLGKIIATNISPSSDYGIGSWTEAQFAKAVRQGRSPNGFLYPAMPYPSYAGMSDDDIHALFTYLKQSVSPVESGPSVKTLLPFPFNLRWLMAGWNLVFARGPKIGNALDDPASVARGEYLVKVVGHCSACHTPRNFLFGEIGAKYLGGAVVGSWVAPNITSDPISGIGGWSDDELVTYLRTGVAVGKSQAAGGMAEAVEHGLSHLTNDDLLAIARYLKSVPPLRDDAQKVPAYGVAFAQPSDVQAKQNNLFRSPMEMVDTSRSDGEQLYLNACASCHQIDGQGTRDQFYPSLFANTSTGGMSPNNLIMAIVKGVHRHTDDAHVAMPAFEHELSDEQIAAISNYVLRRFGNADLTVSPQDVAKLKAGGEKPLLVNVIERLGGLMLFGGAALVGGSFLLYREKRSKKLRQSLQAPLHLEK